MKPISHYILWICEPKSSNRYSEVYRWECLQNQFAAMKGARIHIRCVKDKNLLKFGVYDRA
jgi:hypothetical protein